MVYNQAVQFYNRIFNENPDPRIADWFMAKSPFPTLFICLSYVCTVKYLGPSLMRNRKPLDIRRTMIFYNFSMVLFNIFIFYQFGTYGWFGSYSYKCQPVDYSNSPEALGMLTACWWFYISKMVDFCDTIFFVVRKKYKQVTTLHVVHHSIMPMSVWFGLIFTPGGHSTFFAFINSFVHILMYSYYGLDAIGPHMNKYLWWKKYLTTIQMIQFIAIFVHAFQLLFRDCNYPKGFVWWIGLHAVLFWSLFADFYKNAYGKGKVSKDNETKVIESKEIVQQLQKDSPTKNDYKLSNKGDNCCRDRIEIFNDNGNILRCKYDALGLSNQRVIREHGVKKKNN